MKPLLSRALFAILALLTASAFHAEAIAVLGKRIVVSESLLDYTTPPDERAATFLKKFSGHLKSAENGATEAPLSDFPTYGRNVAGARGSLSYLPRFYGGLPIRVRLSGLTPKHVYLLTLNGNPERAGNGLLADPVPGNEKERFYDFQKIITNEDGTYEATFGILLQAGAYDARFYVKDTDDFKIILYHDFFPFVVE